MPAAAQSSKPYDASSPANGIYQQLFCDDLSAFAPMGDEPAAWQLVLFGPDQDPRKISALAQDAAAESRVRALAFTWLRAQRHDTVKGLVLGMVIEVPLDGGLDVLAAYADGSVRYINQSGKLVIVEPGGLPKANDLAKQLIETAQPVVAKIGPWDQPRLPPPGRPDVRLTFIVSDGLYFGQGPFALMQREPLAGPLIKQSTELLTLVVNEVS